MTFKSIASEDPWPFKCPDPSELEIQELLAILEDHTHVELSEWESAFCESIVRRLGYGLRPTEKQIELLGRGLFKKLWDNDPALWQD